MKSILYLLIAVIWVCSAYTIYGDGDKKVEKKLVDSLNSSKLDLLRLFQIASAYESTIKSQMEKNIQLVKHIENPYFHPMFQSLEDYPNLDAYALNSEKLFVDKVYPAMLTGKGSKDKLNGDTLAEINAALLLSLTAPIKSTSYNFFWSYYLSKNQFIIIEPTIGVNKFRYTDKLHTQPYWLAAIPKNNPLRKTIYSKVFEDEAGQGKIMTIAAPVYHADEFKGVVALDLGLSFLQDELDSYADQIADSMGVITTEGLVVAKKTKANVDNYFIPDDVLIGKKLQYIKKGDSFFILSDNILDRFHLVYEISQSSMRDLIWEEIRNNIYIAILLAILSTFFVNLAYSLRLTREQSRFDGVSKIFNRLTLERLSNEAFSSARKKGEVISLIIIDIDDFKNINDQYGHQAGDKGIRFIAEKIVGNIRKSDIAGRYGGEEFVVTLSGVSLMEAATIAEKIRKEVEQSTFDDNKKLTISAGCAECDTAHDDSDFAKICSLADLALYESKEKGKNRITTYNLCSEGFNNRS